MTEGRCHLELINANKIVDFIPPQKVYCLLVKIISRFTQSLHLINTKIVKRMYFSLS